MGGRCLLLLACLAASLHLSTQQVRTQSDDLCVFPFTYKNTQYTVCTTDHSVTGLPWCGLVGTVPETANPRTWGFCKTTPGSPPPTGTNCAATRTTAGSPCVFPFTYRGTMYNYCTSTRNSGALWCSLDAVYNSRWGNCDLNTCPSTPGPAPGPGRTPPSCPDAKTTTGASCAIPFTYNGQQYHACTTVGNGNTPWCSLDAQYAGRYGNCDPNTCPPACGTAKTLKGAPCSIPFLYKGILYNACTTADNGDKLWCSLDYSYDGNWDNCDISICPESCGSVKTTNNQNCALPFVYRGNTYTTCTTVGNSGNPWCSLDTNYNGRWGQCDLSTCTPVGTTAPPTQPPGACIQKTTNGQNCALPFTYNGVRYTTCVTTGNGNTPWCALDSVYVGGRWGNCAPCPGATAPPPTGTCNVQTVTGQNCYFPFSYNGVTYNECTSMGHTTLWCSTTANYSPSTWAECAITKTTTNTNCVFPFSYRGATYNRCIMEYSTFLWCSTQATMVVGSGNWGQCNACYR